MVHSIVDILLQGLTPTVANATTLLGLIPAMTPTEAESAQAFVDRVLTDTSLSELSEKDTLGYMKIYLKCRQTPEITLEDTLDETQLTRLAELSEPTD